MAETLVLIPGLACTARLFEPQIAALSEGRTILMVEHNMNVVSSIADRITVLQRGAVIADGPYSEVSRNPQVIEAYMGSAENELQGAH